jgi:DNA invertase Pin-like site-specific DNA recombinase
MKKKESHLPLVTSGKLNLARRQRKRIAEMEQETRRERQAAGIAVAKKAGKYRWRKPGTTKAKPERALKLRENGLELQGTQCPESSPRRAVQAVLPRAGGKGYRQGRSG